MDTGLNTRGPLAAMGVAAMAVLVSVSVPVARPTRGDGRPAAAGRRADQEALKPYAGLVGGWKNGVGQVERGRAQGAWTESAAWAWKLSQRLGRAGGQGQEGQVPQVGRAPARQGARHLRLRGDPGRRLDPDLHRQGRRPGRRQAARPDGRRQGRRRAASRRITITPLHDTRLLVLLEAQDPERHAFYRLGEVGYTREGVAFAAGESYPLCIVTEGRGTTQVSYKGKTYWVCCSGCRDLFNDNPESVLAEAAEREKAKKK